jgi:hypothetical protein
VVCEVALDEHVEHVFPGGGSPSDVDNPVFEHPTDNPSDEVLPRGKSYSRQH